MKPIDLNEQPDRLYRYLPAKYAEQTRRTGVYRVYSSASMEAHSTAAQRDDEHRKVQVLKGGVSQFLGRGGDDPYGSTLQVQVQEKDGDAIVEVTAAGAYFLTSFSVKLADRLHDDFQADAVLAVTNVPEFLSRMAKAAASKFMNRHAGAVSYRHPVVVFGRFAVPLPLPFFDKDPEYEYQNEYRLVFICSEQTMPHIQESKDGRDYIDFNLVCCPANNCYEARGMFSSRQGATTPCGRPHTRRSNAAGEETGPRIMVVICGTAH